MSVRKHVLVPALIAASIFSTPASAETILGALAKAYQYNSSLNSARAGVRVTDENVPLAKSKLRPQIGASASVDYSNTWRSGRTIRQGSASYGVEISQMLFDGFQTRNNISAAKAQVRAANESLNNTEQNILLEAATAYMDVIRDRKVSALTDQNLAALREQVRASKTRFEVGEGTRTDVAQADASYASAVALAQQAKARVQISSANYRAIVGDNPGNLSGASALTKMLPRSEQSGISLALEEHPGILARKHLVDAADYGVKSAEGAMLPGVTASADIGRAYSSTRGTGIQDSSNWSTSAGIGARLTIPIYSGGGLSAQVRRSKEELGQSRIEVDVARDQVRQAVSTAWYSYVAATQGVKANRTLVNAQRLALNGVVEERNVGQRTTLDVLNAQAAVLQAQISLVNDEHDVVVASYNVAAAMGRLSAKRLGLSVQLHDPKEHYNAVKDKWYGTTTPDGR